MIETEKRTKYIPAPNKNELKNRLELQEQAKQTLLYDKYPPKSSTLAHILKEELAQQNISVPVDIIITYQDKSIELLANGGKEIEKKAAPRGFFICNSTLMTLGLEKEMSVQAYIHGSLGLFFRQLPAYWWILWFVGLVFCVVELVILIMKKRQPAEKEISVGEMYPYPDGVLIEEPQVSFVSLHSDITEDTEIAIISEKSKSRRTHVSPVSAEEIEEENNVPAPATPIVEVAQTTPPATGQPVLAATTPPDLEETTEEEDLLKPRPIRKFREGNYQVGYYKLTAEGSLIHPDGTKENMHKCEKAYQMLLLLLQEPNRFILNKDIERQIKGSTPNSIVQVVKRLRVLLKDDQYLKIKNKRFYGYMLMVDESLYTQGQETKDNACAVKPLAQAEIPTTN